MRLLHPVVIVALIGLLIACGERGAEEQAQPLNLSPTAIPASQGQAQAVKPTAEMGNVGEPKPVPATPTAELVSPTAVEGQGMDAAQPGPSLLRRRDKPLVGVEAELAVAPGAGGVFCPEDLPQAPRLTLESEPSITVEVGGRFEICVDGFDGEEYITLLITAPDGTSSAILPFSNNSRRASRWQTLADDLLGTYTVRAVQGQDGERQASATFTVLAATSPRFIVTDDIVRPGGVLAATLVGAPANEFVSVLLYQYGSCSNPQIIEGCFTYLATLPKVRSDARGTAPDGARWYTSDDHALRRERRLALSPP